jgi:hypothetical protein
MHPQGVANLLWALSKHREKTQMNNLEAATLALLPTSLKLMPYFKPQELASVLQSLSEVGKTWREDENLDTVFLTAAKAGASGQLSDEWSLTSVVKALQAYKRFMGDEFGTMEPCCAFLNELICQCGRNTAKLDGHLSQAIVEALPAVWNPTSQAREALEFVVRSTANTTVCRHNSPHAVAGNVSSGSLKQILSCYSIPQQNSAQCDEGVADELAAAVVSIPYESWLSPELRNQVVCKASDGEPAYVCASEVTGTLHEPLAPRLMLVEEFNCTDICDGTISIMFEVSSAATLESYDVLAKCSCDGQLYDTIHFGMNAGVDIPNTHVLNLGGLHEGQHEIDFTLSTGSCVHHREKTSFRVSHSQRTSSLAKDFLPDWIRNKKVLPGRGSSGGSTCFGVSSTSEASDEWIDSDGEIA